MSAVILGGFTEFMVFRIPRRILCIFQLVCQYKYYNCSTRQLVLEITKDEEAALKGEHGEIMQMAYRILVATGETTDAERLVFP